MSLLNECKQLFGTSDLYELLEVKKDATEKIIKQAYRKLSLKVHPDRVSNDDKKHATQRFQVLSKVSAILLNKDLRAAYDEDGRIDEDGELTNNLKGWKQYWKNVFNLTFEDMKNFEDSYRDSQEEHDELKAIYVEYEGDMDKIFQKHICARIEEEPRLRNIIQSAIDAGEVPDFDNFSKEPEEKKRKRKKHYEKEAREAAKMREKMGFGESSNQDDIRKTIQRRQKDRQKEMDDFISSLEAKYAQPSKRKKPSTSGRKKKKT